ncbi:mono-functional DNA-alkylating methyl methanesulfonate N-term-domain-containing protein [Massariosphaeria phaeospora]|uniref:Mono-functional DNA-alkylating methyl methanesulfonate N-term-domain-containing protein n=1 Tax=Massariosphaeria phaeospora TaxID=100035 RepID=A0A7C8M8Z9_9PLEO|nr:mono-functional DNA-alkylating methyl methanesulfonate N-term-domain-containing protein [Massariosphaeria phaeospora]
MENQIQRQVLVDGEWVSRPADVYQIMARAQQQEDTQPRVPESNSELAAPTMGILSRTVFGSPYLKFILPANIRHRDLNDVVFIGEESVHLNEIRDYGHLRHVATKTDLKGRILAARVFGAPRKIQANTEYGTLYKRSTVHGARRSFTPEEAETLPPEVIVLTLTSRTLMFLWARQCRAGNVTFCQRTVRLPAGSSRFDRPGTFLAVDPHCRAIAVAAPEGRFVLYKTKPMDKWRDNDRTGSEALPIEDERIIPFQGRILHMEFLSSGGAQDDSHVVLVFVLIQAGKTKITCYDWDARSGLESVCARAERLAINAEDHNPSLLIPLARNPDFLLVCNTHISTYKDILSGVPKRYQAKIAENVLSPARPGDGRNTPRWVQWARAPRNPDYIGEALYIARDDGVVMYADRGASPPMKTEDAGIWPHPIDTAFACLAVANSRYSQSFPDLLIAAGTASDGLLCKVGAWPIEYAFIPYPGNNTFAFVESIPNWAPLTDLAVTPLPGVPGGPESDLDTVLIANGRAPHGMISELRQGLNAAVDDAFRGMTGCTGLWAIDYSNQSFEKDGGETKQHQVTFIITLPLETMLVRISRVFEHGRGRQGEVRSAWDDGSWDKVQIPDEGELPQDGVTRDLETISACAWSPQFAIQITCETARLLRRPALTHVDSLVFPNRLLSASSKADHPLIVVAFREATSPILEVIEVRDEGGFGQRCRSILPHDPTCIEILTLYGTPHVFVGTVDARVMLFNMHEANLVLVLEISLHSEASYGLESSWVCETAVLLDYEKHSAICCGTRNGYIVSLYVERSIVGDYSVLFTQMTNMGSTSARVTSSATDSEVAFVACGSDFVRVRSPQQGMSKVEIDSIWFTGRDDLAITQSSVTAIYQIPLSSGPTDERDLGGFIFAVSGDQMIFAQLDYDIRWSSYDNPPRSSERGKVVPRKVVNYATPSKLLWVKGLRQMVIATTETKEERPSPDGYRVMRSSIKLLDIHDDTHNEQSDSDQEDDVGGAFGKLLQGEYYLKHYERVYSLVEWSLLSERGRKTQLIIVGTGITTATGIEVGRKLFLRVRGSDLKLSKDYDYDQPVRCMALYDDNTLVTIYGKTLLLEQYSFTTSRWHKGGTKELPSAGICLSISKPFVYVSTAHDSHICYEAVHSGDENDIKFDFRQVFTDSRQRSSAHHLVLPMEPDVPAEDTEESSVQRAPAPSTAPSNPGALVLLSDKSCSVTGLYHRRGRKYKTAAESMFEATLPRSVIRIQRGNIRRPWRRPCNNYGETYSSPGVEADNIIGACSDGTIYAFSILTAPATRLLKLLQNLIEAKQRRDPASQYSIVKPSGDVLTQILNDANRPHDEVIGVREVDPIYGEYSATRPREAHVDGDVLARFFLESEDADLVDLLSEQTDKTVWDLFYKLAEEVLEGGHLSSTTEEDDPVELTQRWLRELLMPPL